MFSDNHIDEKRLENLFYELSKWPNLTTIEYGNIKLTLNNKLIIKISNIRTLFFEFNIDES